MSKKEKNGSVYYAKKDNRWRCMYYIQDKDTGKEIRKTKSFMEEDEARNFLTSIEYQKGNELFIKNNGIPLNQLMRQITEKKYELNLISDRTYGRSLETIKNIEKSEISKKNIEDITSKEIQSYLNTLKDYSDSTIKKVREKLSQAFTEAMNNDYIRKNPMTNVITPKSNKEKKEVRALETEEQQALTNYLENVLIDEERYKVAYLLELYTGMRIGEVLALRNSDIDLQKGVIMVTRTLTTDQYHNIIMGNKTKTYAGKREIPIPIQIRDDVIEQMKIAEGNRDKQLFVNRSGGYARPTDVNRMFTQMINCKLGITGVSSHSLRHTYATRAIEAGMQAVVLQRLMGHKDIAVTMNTYTSVFNKYKESEIEKLNQYYMNNALFGKEETIGLLENSEYTEEHAHER